MHDTGSQDSPPTNYNDPFELVGDTKVTKGGSWVSLEKYILEVLFNSGFMLIIEGRCSQISIGS